MPWGDTLILVISRGVQLYYGIAQSSSEPDQSRSMQLDVV